MLENFATRTEDGIAVALPYEAAQLVPPPDGGEGN
jgi:hypothetical protein